MKYVLMFVRNDEQWLESPGMGESYEAIGRWFADLGRSGKIVETGSELQPARSATTVRWTEGKPLVTDGPFLESKEVIAGFTTIEAADLDEAIHIAQSWPAQDHAVEIRPVIEHGPVG